MVYILHDTPTNEFLFLAIYSQIAPKIMRWHQVFRTKTPKKWMKKPKQYQKISKIDEIAKFR
jgi:hypothetical protein